MIFLPIRMKPQTFPPHKPARYRASLILCLALGSLPELNAAEIHDLAEKGDVQALGALIKVEAGLVQLKDKAGDMPLHYAVQKDQIEAAKLLLENGAEVNSKGFDDWTPLHWAAKVGSKQMCQLLLENGANPKALNGVQRTPLQMATGSAVQFLKDLESPPVAPPAKVVATAPAPAPAPAPPPPEPAPPSPPPTPAPAMVSKPEQFAPVVTVTTPTTGTLLAALDKKSITGLESLLAQGGDANSTNSEGLSLLQLAVSHGSAGLVKMLLEHGAKPNAPVKAGDYPLISATKADSTEIVNALIHGGADLNVRDSHGLTALLSATLYGRSASGQLLIDAGADLAATATGYDLTPLHLAAANGVGARAVASGKKPGSEADFAALTKALLAHRASVNAPSSIGTPLMVAVRGGSVEIANLLINQGAQVDATWALNGYTPLMVAASSGRTSAIELLLKHGANLNARTPVGATALHIAAEADQVEAVTALIKAGLAIDSPDSVKATALITAAAMGKLNAVKTLVSLGAKTDAAADQGITALKAASQQNQPEVVAFLKSKGAKE